MRTFFTILYLAAFVVCVVLKNGPAALGFSIAFILSLQLDTHDSL